jgi:hypothetical protein
MPTKTHQAVKIDLSGIEIEDIKIFVQEGARGIPEMLASSALHPPMSISCGGGCATEFGEEEK